MLDTFEKAFHLHTNNVEPLVSETLFYRSLRYAINFEYMINYLAESVKSSCLKNMYEI